MKVVVAQKSSREHYLAARALHRRGMLARLVTDFQAPLGGRGAAWVRDRGWGALSRAFGRTCDEVPRSLITSLPVHALLDQWRLGRARARDNIGDAYAAGGRDFASRVARLRLPPHDAVFCYSTAALETLQAARARGALAVLDQLDPGPLEYDLVAEEARLWPQYTRSRWPPQHDVTRRLAAEWATADVIVVNSEWSREAIVARGADPAKIEVLPLAFERPGGLHPRQPPPPLRVAWLGRVVIQKGIQYLVEAARLLQGEPVEILVAGDTDVPEATRREAPSVVRWLGKLTARDADALLASSHVFVLPTLSDGFALTQLEAFAHGLPVITTPRCGLVVEEGRTGFLVPPRDPVALAAAIARFLHDPGLSAAMAQGCVQALGRFTLDVYATGLALVLQRAAAGRRAPELTWSTGSPSRGSTRAR